MRTSARREKISVTSILSHVVSGNENLTMTKSTHSLWSASNSQQQQFMLTVVCDFGGPIANAHCFCVNCVSLLHSLHTGFTTSTCHQDRTFPRVPHNRARACQCLFEDHCLSPSLAQRSNRLNNRIHSRCSSSSGLSKCLQAPWSRMGQAEWHRIMSNPS